MTYLYSIVPFRIPPQPHLTTLTAQLDLKNLTTSQISTIYNTVFEDLNVAAPNLESVKLNAREYINSRVSNMVHSSVHFFCLKSDYFCIMCLHSIYPLWSRLIDKGIALSQVRL